MRIIKPLRLGLLQKPFRWQDENLLGVSMLALAGMEERPLLRPEVELWDLLQRELTATDGILDLGYPKPYPEFLATGHAYTAGQEDKTRRDVAIEVDGVRKSLVAWGERHWLARGGCSKPEPFESVRLDWSTAYGGPAHADNPFGIGVPPKGQPHTALPRVEAPDAPITAPGQKRAPAGFGPLGLQWPCRARLAGERYDARWLATHFPGFAEDFDARYFNMAGPDQIRTDVTQWTPGAAYAIHGMHPSRPGIEGRLPAWNPRCFVNRRIGTDEVFEEIAMRHTTVWFFPHLEQMVLVYHGSVRIREDDAEDVGALMPALEPVGQVREIEHYRRVWLQREDRDRRALYAFQEADLLPADAIGPWIDTETTAPASAMQNNMAERRRRMEDEHEVARATDEDAQLATERPSLAELPAFKARLEARAEQAKQQVHASARKQGFDPEKESQPEARPSGPKSLHDMQDALERQAKAFPDSMPPEKLAASRASLHEMYLHAVEAQAKPPRLDADAAAALRRQIGIRLAADRNLDGMDLTGADLSGLDLSRCSLRRALLENADLSGCKLDHSDLGEAVLARAELRGASLREARLDRATLFQTDCSDTDFGKASLLQTRLQDTTLHGCNFAGCRIEGITLGKCFFVDCRFEQARIGNLMLSEVLLRQCSFGSAWLHKLAFHECLLDGVDFSDAQLSNCSWVDCQLTAVFRRSEIRNCSAALATVLHHPDFREARLSQCNLRGIVLHQADLRGAKALGCDFSQASLKAADFTQADASESSFGRSDLQGAVFARAKLLSAVLSKARLQACDFRGANLFRADLSQCETDDATDWDGAYTVQTRHAPRPRDAAAT